MESVFVIMLDNSDHIDGFAFGSKKEAEIYIEKQIEAYGKQCKYNEAWVEEVAVYRDYKEYSREGNYVTCKKCGGIIKQTTGVYIIMKICQLCGHESVERVQKKRGRKKETLIN